MAAMAAIPSPLPALLARFSWREWRQHPWRHAAAVLSVALGVALAFAVHLINASALSEFSQAVRAVGGQPDLEVRAAQGGFDETLFGRLAKRPEVALASPVLELTTYAAGGGGADRPAVRVLGLDALAVAPLSPSLMPQPDEGEPRFVLFAPDAAFVNAAARALAAAHSNRLTLQAGLTGAVPLRVAGHVAASGPPLVVMDIAAAQQAFGRLGQLTRIDLRLAAGVNRDTFAAALRAEKDWPAGVLLAAPGDDAQRVSALSRAYRVNLTVLALVALFTGAFLVFSVLSLGVARRSRQFALLATLGLTARERLLLVLAETALLGTLGSALGVALGGGLAALALRLLGGDLGGGYFPGVTPVLLWDGGAALGYGALGVAAALVGGWWPARAAQRLPPAQALKGLGAAGPAQRRIGAGLLLVAAALALACVPPVGGIALAAYGAVALLLVGGIALLPPLLERLLDAVAPLLARRPLALLAVERARRVPGTAAVAVGGVVASLSLAVALTVMVASFRDSVANWLAVVLPADLYARAASSAAAGDTVFFGPEVVAAAARMPGVARLTPQRVRSLQLNTRQPAVALVARRIDDPAHDFALVGAALPVPPGRTPIWVSEAIIDLYGVRPGGDFPAFSEVFRPLAIANAGDSAPFFVAGVLRDYARQFGAVAIDDRAYAALTGDRNANDLAFTLAPGADAAAVQQALRDLADRASPGAGARIEFASAAQIRAASLRIFDRSFAVTYWLQAVAIGIGLFGVAASFSAQVLARRKEFGLLAHLGLTRRQILAVVAGEGAAFSAAGALAGLALGLGVALVLVFVVNPQSFHWSMDLALPPLRLAALGAAVVLAGTATAWLSGRAAAGADAVLAVREDW